MQNLNRVIKNVKTLRHSIDTVATRFWECQGAVFQKGYVLSIKDIKNLKGKDIYSFPAQIIKDPKSKFICSHADLGLGYRGQIVVRLWVKLLKKDNHPHSLSVILTSVDYNSIY